MLADAEAQLSMMVRSRQQGLELGELFSHIIFGAITVVLTLLSPPAVTGWIGFLLEMLMALFSVVIVFLAVNVWDSHRNRSGEILDWKGTRNSTATTWLSEKRSIAGLNKRRPLPWVWWGWPLSPRSCGTSGCRDTRHVRCLSRVPAAARR
jgi:hypothetical protein